jgi:twitching motility protein PilT
MAAATLRIENLLEEVVKRKASDLHLQVGLAPMIRVDGKLGPISGTPVLTEESVGAFGVFNS